MSIVTLDLDKDVIALLEEQQYQPISEAAHELYRRGALSSGKGAQLLGIPGTTSSNALPNWIFRIFASPKKICKTRFVKVSHSDCGRF